MDPRRARILFVVVVLALFVPVVIVLAAGSGDDDEGPTGLTIKTDPSRTSVSVYLEAGDAPEVKRSDGFVEIECRDRAGKVDGRATQPWPFADTDNGTTEPHAHVEGILAIEKLARCEVLGTDPPLGGDVSARG